MLHPVLQYHGNTQNENDIYADDAKRGREDPVEILVGGGRKLADAATLLRSNKGVYTSGILDEWRRGRVHEAAAVKLHFVSMTAYDPPRGLMLSVALTGAYSLSAAEDSESAVSRVPRDR